MTVNKKEKRKQVKALKKAHDQRAKLIDRVAKARTKFEKRTRKLQDVETHIAELSRSVFGNDAPTPASDVEPGAPAEEAMAFGAQQTADAADGNNDNKAEVKVTELPDDPAASE